MGCGKSGIYSQKQFLLDELNSKNKIVKTCSQIQGPQRNSIKINLREQVNHRKGRLYEFYEIGETLGEGSFGSVRKGVQLSTNQEVAIKTIIKSYVQRTDDTNAILEVEILRNLDHPNILKIKEVIEDMRNYHIITELCTGGELFSKISLQQSLSESTVSLYMNQVLSALAFCHERGVLHRDIKPENLLFQFPDDNSPIKIIDFGVSDLNNNLKAMNIEQLTSIFYKAPEQFSNFCSDKSDVWSVGVIIYLMLSGYLPFKGKNEQKMELSIKNSLLDFNSPEWENISDFGKDLLAKILEKDPEKRISAKDALLHPWIQNGHSQYLLTRTVTDSGIKNLLKFRFHAKLRHAVLEFIISHFCNSSEISELQQAFISMDLNGDGKLSPEEINLVCLLMNYPQKDMNNLLEQCDANMNGCIDYTEFLTAATNWRKVLNKNKLKASFESFDLDKDGAISLLELKQVLHNDYQVEDLIWEEIFQEVDTNKDGLIDMSEFHSAVMLKTSSLSPSKYHK